MFPAKRVLISMVLAVMIPAAAARGQETEPKETVQGQLKTLISEVQDLRRDNVSMRDEIDELRAQSDDQWLSESRSEQIRQIVQDVLADADTRASLLNDGLIAGWSDHFFLASPDGRFKLQVGGQLQTRWIYNFKEEADRHVQGFENTRTKLLFQGHVISPDWTYQIQTDFSRSGGAATLEDAWIRHDLNNEVSIRVGQFKLPFTRETLVSSSRQLAVERSLIDAATNIGRAQGIELTIEDQYARFTVAFSDGGQDNLGRENGFNIVQVAPSINTPALASDTEYALTGRFELLVAGNWEQFQDFTSPIGDEFGLMLGVAVHSQDGEDGTSGARGNRWLAWTADLSAEFGGASFYAAITHHYIDSRSFFFNGFGVQAQASMYLTQKWEVFTRFEYGWIDFDFPATSFVRSDLNLLTIGANYYIDGHDLKWTTDIGLGLSQIEDFWSSNISGYRSESEDLDPQVVFRTQLQLLF